MLPERGIGRGEEGREAVAVAADKLKEMELVALMCMAPVATIALMMTMTILGGVDAPTLRPTTMRAMGTVAASSTAARRTLVVLLL